MPSINKSMAKLNSHRTIKCVLYLRVPELFSDILNFCSFSAFFFVQSLVIEASTYAIIFSNRFSACFELQKVVCFLFSGLLESCVCLLALLFVLRKS